MTPDAVVIGAGHNGLVAANVLADEGWEVLVLEAQSTPGGAVQSETFANGFRRDLFSAFYPLAVGSPAMRSLDLESHGLRWRRAPLVLAHAGRDAATVILSQDLDHTADSLDRNCPGDGAAWRRLYGRWQRLGDHVLDTLLTSFPPLRPAAATALQLRSEVMDFARFALLPVRRLADEHFGGSGAPMLLAGNALHADLAPDSPLSGFFGWLLCCLGQQHGFPVPEGGAGQLTAALAGRLESRGGRIVCNACVEQIVVSRGRAVGVRTTAGDEIRAKRAVLANVGAPALYRELLAREHVPERIRRRLTGFQYDNATVKVDWALDRPIPWRHEPPHRAGTIHVADGIDHLGEVAVQLASNVVPARPFLIMGQMTTADPGRSPSGTESAWAYTHVPQSIRRDAGGSVRGTWDDDDTAQFVSRIERRVEDHAPGFMDTVVDRAVLTPRTLEGINPNLVRGAINGGTAQLHQQLVFRPLPDLGTPGTPIRGLYLASASAHPGGGVHGACGANAARAALTAWRRRRFIAAATAAAAIISPVAARRTRQRRVQP